MTQPLGGTQGGGIFGGQTQSIGGGLFPNAGQQPPHQQQPGLPSQPSFGPGVNQLGQ